MENDGQKVLRHHQIMIGRYGEGLCYSNILSKRVITFCSSAACCNTSDNLLALRLPTGLLCLSYVAKDIVG